LARSLDRLDRVGGFVLGTTEEMHDGRERSDGKSIREQGETD
jgi:hypothetical protein